MGFIIRRDSPLTINTGTGIENSEISNFRNTHAEYVSYRVQICDLKEVTVSM